MQRTSTLNRVLALVAALLLAVGVLFALTGCQSDEDKVKEAISNELDILVNHDDMDSITSLIDEDDLNTLGIDADELFTNWLDGFAYEIGEVTVEDDYATAEVSITCKQFVTAYNNSLESMKTAATNAVANGTTDTDAITQLVAQELLTGLSSVEPATTECTLTLTKTDGEWTLDSSASYELEDALLGDVSTMASL